MRAIHTWMFIAATILIGLVAGLSANAQEFRVKVTTKDKAANYFAVTSDHRLLAVVCKQDLLNSTLSRSWQYTADLVFPNDQGELDLKGYREGADMRPYTGPKSAYRPIPPDHAKAFCSQPFGEFVFYVNDDSATIASRRSVSVQSFGVGRRSL